MASPPQQISTPVNLSIVIPAYDELPNLRELLPVVNLVMSGIPDVEAEVLVVVRGGASSAECDEISGMGAKPVIRAPTDSFGDALRTGFAAAAPTSSLIVTLDADGSHDPETLPAMLAAAPHAHVVVGSRYVDGGATDNSLALRMMSRALNMVYARVLGLACRDVSTNYKIYRHVDLARVDLTCRDFDVVEEIMFRLKDLHGSSFRIIEIPDHFRERRHGVTKRRLGPFVISYVGTLIRLRWQMRHRRG